MTGVLAAVLLGFAAALVALLRIPVLGLTDEMFHRPQERTRTADYVNGRFG
ncbi:hypothetical protein [Streptomyces sp. LN549]|uniref:hypothetical protein n=1 Tax=Streptomyces sp. LN549 TaxID=3112979 RepID=UPI00371F62CF